MTACLAAERCRDPQRPIEAPEPSDPPWLCQHCVASAARDVALLAHDWRDLEQLLPRPISVWSDGLPRSSGEAPVPLRLDVEELQARIWWLCTAWAEVLAEVARLSPPQDRRPSPLARFFAGSSSGLVLGWRPVRVEHPSALSRRYRAGPVDVVRAVAVLGPRVGMLARLPGVEFASYPVLEEAPEDVLRTLFAGIEVACVSGARGVLDLVAAHQRARLLLGLTEPVWVLPGRCQVRGCGAAALRVRDGSDTVWCDRCGTSMTRDDYDRLGNLFGRVA